MPAKKSSKKGGSKKGGGGGGASRKGGATKGAGKRGLGSVLSNIGTIAGTVGNIAGAVGGLAGGGTATRRDLTVNVSRNADINAIVRELKKKFAEAGHPGCRSGFDRISFKDLVTNPAGGGR